MPTVICIVCCQSFQTEMLGRWMKASAILIPQRTDHITSALQCSCFFGIFRGSNINNALLCILYDSCHIILVHTQSTECTDCMRWSF